MTSSACTYVLASQSSIASYRSATVAWSRYSSVTGSKPLTTSLPVLSSRPPLIAYSSALATFTRAPKNCICLPTAIAETQQAIAVSSPYFGRISSSDSNWSAEVSMATFEANSLNPAGSRCDQKTVRFGSGAGPRL